MYQGTLCIAHICVRYLLCILLRLVVCDTCQNLHLFVFFTSNRSFYPSTSSTPSVCADSSC